MHVHSCLRVIGRAATHGLLALVATSSLWFSATAQAKYPDSPIRLIIPFTPAGAVDGVGRLSAKIVSTTLGGNIVVQNVPGAGSVVGLLQAAHAKPDGYTLLMGNIATASAPALYKGLTIDPAKTFKGVSIIGTSPYILVVAPNFPAHNLKELIALAKANPGKYNFGSAGTGSAIHLAGELFKSMAGVNIVHIPFEGAGPALVALLSGQVQMVFGSPMDVVPMIKAGKLRAIAVTSAQPSPIAPGVPTMAASGVPGYEVTGWYGWFAPKGTPDSVIQILNEAAQKALDSPEGKKELANYMLTPVGGTPAQAAALLTNEEQKWTTVIKQAGIKPN